MSAVITPTFFQSNPYFDPLSNYNLYGFWQFVDGLGSTGLTAISAGGTYESVIVQTNSAAVDYGKFYYAPYNSGSGIAWVTSGNIAGTLLGNTDATPFSIISNSHDILSFTAAGGGLVNLSITSSGFSAVTTVSASFNAGDEFTVSAANGFVLGVTSTTTGIDATPTSLDIESPTLTIGTASTSTSQSIGNSSSSLNLGSATLLVPNLSTTTQTSVLGVNTGTGAVTYTLGTALGFKWNITASSTVAVVQNNGYISSANASFTLPTVCALGSVIGVGSFNGGGWTLHQNAGQQINFGALQTTIGTGGTVSTTELGISVILVCILANTDFLIIGYVGNITLA